MGEWFLVVVSKQQLRICHRCCDFRAEQQVLQQLLEFKLSDIRGILISSYLPSNRRSCDFATIPMWLYLVPLTHK